MGKRNAQGGASVEFGSSWAGQRELGCWMGGQGSSWSLGLGAALAWRTWGWVPGSGSQEAAAPSALPLHSSPSRPFPGCTEGSSFELPRPVPSPQPPLTFTLLYYSLTKLLTSRLFRRCSYLARCLNASNPVPVKYRTVSFLQARHNCDFKSITIICNHIM